MATKSSLKLDTKSLLAIVKRVTDPIKAHHALIMFVLLMGVLIYTVISVGAIIQVSDDSEYRAEVEAKSLNTSFDQATIKKVDELRQSDDNTSIILPEGRRNPFVD
jgi:hypothetical protein